MRYRRGFELGPIEFLIIANLIVYVVVSIRLQFLPYLGLQPANFLSAPWTLLTSMFVHAPFPIIWHILGNMFTLYFFGNYLLELVREKNFFIVYLGGGILGNILFMLLAFLSPVIATFPIDILRNILFVSPFSTVYGASGAIFALGGALAAMRPRLPVIIFPIPVPIPLWIAVIGGFLIMSFVPFVAWEAHLGGLLFGLLAGYIFRRREGGRFSW